MMWQGKARDRLQGMSTKTRQRVRAWIGQLVVIALGAMALIDIWVVFLPDGIPGLRPVNTLIFFLICLALVWRRRAPVAVLFTVMVLVGVQAVFFNLSFRNPAELPPFESFLAMLLCFYSLAAYGEERRAVLAGVTAGFLIVAVDILRLRAGVSTGNIVPSWTFYAAVWFIGRTIRKGRLQAARLQDLAAQLELEREEKTRTAVAEERSRISRELHDVIAHSVSVMVVQAQAAQRLLEGEQREARQALGSIETTGRQALTEMRRLLGILRRTDAELALTPQPSLKYLEALIKQVREAGLPAELHIQGESKPLPPGVDLSAYRIVQEALTNCLKHAGPSHAKVRVHYGEDELELEISDDGAGNGKGEGSGQGLIGMRERVTLYGGVLESGKRDGGGYLVRARLPLDPEQP